MLASWNDQCAHMLFKQCDCLSIYKREKKKTQAIDFWNEMILISSETLLAWHFREITVIMQH